MEAGGGTDYGLRRITGDEPPLRDGRVMGGEDGGERRRAEERKGRDGVMVALLRALRRRRRPHSPSPLADDQRTRSRAP